MENLISKIVKGSGNAVKSFFGVGSFDSSSLISPMLYRNDTPFGRSGWLFNAGGPGVDVHFSFNGLSDVIKSYEQCPPVFSIINKQAYAYVNGKTWITNSRGKEATTPYAKKVKALLVKPNALQNGKQFDAQVAIYLRLFGHCIIFPIKPKGYPNEDATALWIIPPYMCEFSFAKQTFYNLKKGFITSIKVKYGQEESTLNPEDVIIIRDITPGFDTLFLPGSPIKPLQQNINNLIGIYNSKGMLINYRGALGILSPEKEEGGSIPLSSDEKEEMQDELLKYGLRRGQWKFIIANSAMRWQQIGIPYRDLMLTEWAEDDVRAVCDGLNYPFKLLANTESSSMNGTEVDSFKKILYQDFVIPFAEMIYEQLSEAFKAEENNCTIEKDYSHVQVLQEDDSKKAQARKTRNDALQIEFYNNMLTLNRWLELNGEDTLMGEEGKMYYYQLVQAGWTFGKTGMSLSDLTGAAGQQQQNTNQTQNNQLTQ